MVEGKKVTNVYRAHILLILAVLFWSGNTIVGRAIHESVPPIALAFWRWSFALCILLPFTIGHVRRDWPVIKANIGLIVLLSALGVASFNTLLYVGLHSTSAINALLIQSTIPFVIVGMAAIVFRERISAFPVFGILAALAGTVVIIGEGKIHSLQSITASKGDLYVGLGVLCYSAYAIFLRFRPDIHPLSLVGVSFFIGVLLLFPAYLWEVLFFARAEWSRLTLLSIGYLAIFPSIISFLFFNEGVAAIGAAQAGQYLYLMPVFGSVMAIIGLGESMQLFHAVGFLLIVLGIGMSYCESHSGVSSS